MGTKKLLSSVGRSYGPILVRLADYTDGMSSACRFSGTTIYENGIKFNYALPRRVVQRSSALLVL